MTVADRAVQTAHRCLVCPPQPATPLCCAILLPPPPTLLLPPPLPAADSSPAIPRPLVEGHCVKQSGPLLSPAFSHASQLIAVA